MSEIKKLENNREEEPRLAEIKAISDAIGSVIWSEIIPEFVEEPLVNAAHSFYSKNIRTTYSTANRDDIKKGKAILEIDFRTLSDTNKAIAKKYGAIKKGENGGRTIDIVMPVNEGTTVKEIEQYFEAVADGFHWQPWLYPSETQTPDQFKADFGLRKGDPDYDHPNFSPENIAKEEGMYYSKKENLLYRHPEHFIREKTTELIRKMESDSSFRPTLKEVKAFFGLEGDETPENNDPSSWEEACHLKYDPQSKTFSLRPY